MTVLYFSSTGNCLYVAKRIGGDKMSIPICIEENVREIEDNEIGIVFPIYGLCIPPFIEDFIKNISVDCEYFFAIATYGFFPGAVCGQLKEISTKNHMNNYEFPTGVGITADVSINDNCVGCKTCEKVCPMNNISIVDKKPSFDKNCVSCGACIQNCPKNALHHIREKSEARYRNPHIELEELFIS